MHLGNDGIMRILTEYKNCIDSSETPTLAGTKNLIHKRYN